MSSDLPVIAILGYGAMGREVERIALAEGYTVNGIYDIDSPLTDYSDYNFDVAIDFTFPTSVVNNIEQLSKFKKNIVIGTTGWQDNFKYISEMIESANTGLVYGSNFSVGMQMFYKIIRKAATILNNTDGYDIMLHEMHHKRKKDSPSGSALSLADIILDEVDSKTGINTETSHERINSEALHVSSTRGGEIYGLHTVYIDSFADTLELTHRAKNRSGFATGALMAAKWIYNRKGMHDFSEMLDSVWSGK